MPGDCTAPGTGPRSRSLRSRAAAGAAGPRAPACRLQPPRPGDVEGRDYQTEGRLSASVLAALNLPRDAQACICGPAVFMADLPTALAGMGIDNVRTEIFGVRPRRSPSSVTRGNTPSDPAQAAHSGVYVRGGDPLVDHAS